MNKAIRILDSQDNFLRVTLSEILDEIPDGISYHWAILFLDGILNPNQNLTIFEYEKNINQSVNGLIIDWKKLLKLSDSFFQMYEITLIGSKEKNKIKRFKTDKEMYEQCDVVIELIDRSFWEVRSKERALILRLQRKFKEIELLT